MTLYGTTRDVLGRAAYIKRSCDLLMLQVKSVEKLVSGTEHLDPMEEGQVANANIGLAERAAEHVELATRFIEDWNQALTVALAARRT
jgi:hypothetical protein